jgi:acyl-[acyl-carrier-protein]-phospholipid O-acyltransferase/long-chain-fatty-acid--[acyl-carrier-protein] ligase
MSDDQLETEPTRRQWTGFWSMILQQAQNGFSDKMAQFTLITLGGAVAFAFLIPVGRGIAVDVPSAAGLMMALPMILFAPIAGWLSDRFSKRDVMVGAAVTQGLILVWISGWVMVRNLPLALCGFFALAVQSAFFSPAKIGISKELVGSKHLGFASGIQQMTAMLAVLAGQIFAGWWFDHRLQALGGGSEMAWQAAVLPLWMLAGLSIPALALAIAIPRVPAQGGGTFSRKLVFSHFTSLTDLWRDAPLRRASFGVAFFWGSAAFINLWSVKLAQSITHGGTGFGSLLSVFMAAASLGMAAGFGCASYLLRKRIELGWVPVAGLAMTLAAVALAFMTPGSWVFLITLGMLAFSAAVFLTPLNAWMQDRYPAAKRGELQSAANVQDCFAGILAVLLIGAFDYAAKLLQLAPEVAFRIEIAFLGVVCGLASVSIIRLLPSDFIRLVGIALIRAIYRIKSVHLDHVPTQGGVLLLPNHVTFADAFFITAACPRPVRFVMDEAFMAHRAVRVFVSLFQTVTIRRDQPREAIRITIEALKNGDLVCLFPEGQLTRTGTLTELRRGFELIARKAGHPLLPLWCDGSWGSIFSFERGRFFKKRPYQVRYDMTFAFGPPLEPSADLETVRQALWQCSASAVGKRFEAPGWGMRLANGELAATHDFRSLDGDARRRLWINGHQIGQISALQRRQPFAILAADPATQDLPSVLLTFPELFDVKVNLQPEFTLAGPAVWVGGDVLRFAISQSGPIHAAIVFYDFGAQATEPFDHPGVLHCPCLAIAGVVIAMSMPDPALPQTVSEPQSGRKPRSWGKLLPGWYPRPADHGQLRIHGPAAPAEGLELPPGCTLDAEGFLMQSEATLL